MEFPFQSQRKSKRELYGKIVENDFHISMWMENVDLKILDKCLKKNGQDRPFFDEIIKLIEEGFE